MDAKGLLNALISHRLDMPRVKSVEWLCGYEDALIHAVMIVHGMDEDTASEWLSEELNERAIARAD